MIDLTTITAEQANKIECALLALESAINAEIDGNQKLAADESLPMSTRTNLESNAQWWKEVHTLIYGGDN